MEEACCCDRKIREGGDGRMEDEIGASGMVSIGEICCYKYGSESDEVWWGRESLRKYRGVAHTR